ncbi:MAG: hypothetical protein M1814_003566 [Vezdaea aestivalis]|nr:MAG: hypothetical protein M1814_003566 [Vezdaea aestivalis]
MSMITTTTWIPRGYASAHPSRYTFDEEEYSRIADLAKLQLEDAKEDLEEAENPKEVQGEEDELKEYDLGNYDEDEEEKGKLEMFGNVRSLAFYGRGEEDPYVTLNKDDESDGDREELEILPTDNLLLAGRVEDEVSHLEIYVYEDSADNLYVHHDIMLPAVPLCVEWLDMPVGEAEQAKKGDRGCYVAVGTLDPDIEVWDVDTVDGMYPNAILGRGGDEAAIDGAKKKAKKKKKANDAYHVDAVLALAANRKHRHLLASASADGTVKLWDLRTATAASSYGYHTDKVCALAWHREQPEVLLSGSYDRTIVAADMRAPGAEGRRWKVESDVEIVKWDPDAENCFYVSTEGGAVHYHDVRQGSASSSSPNTKSVWTLDAHAKAVSTLDCNTTIPGFLATGSPDKKVKLWKIGSSGPSLVAERNVGVGKVFSVGFAPESEVAFRLAVAGSESVQVWDTSTNPAVRRAFAEKVPSHKGEEAVKERFVGLVEDSSDSEVEGGAEPGGEMEED